MSFEDGPVVGAHSIAEPELHEIDIIRREGALIKICSSGSHSGLDVSFQNRHGYKNSVPYCRGYFKI